MWAKQFSVNRNKLKKVFFYSLLTFAFLFVCLNYVRFERIIYQDLDDEVLKSIILPNLISSSTLTRQERIDLQAVLNIFEKENLSVEIIVIDQYKDVTFFAEGIDFRFNLNRNVNELVNIFISYFQSDKWKNINQNNKNMLEYVDARFDNKVFVKKKEVTSDGVLASTTRASSSRE